MNTIQNTSPIFEGQICEAIQIKTEKTPVNTTETQNLIERGHAFLERIKNGLNGIICKASPSCVNPSKELD